ncbi:hypothetical protein HK104_010932 [Borealophlyctis nickersoniae]|nr:hypothetical protein HK104_010932 [Borealophlyctis nickersoniae]
MSEPFNRIKWFIIDKNLTAEQKVWAIESNLREEERQQEERQHRRMADPENPERACIVNWIRRAKDFTRDQKTYLIDWILNLEELRRPTEDLGGFLYRSSDNGQP